MVAYTNGPASRGSGGGGDSVVVTGVRRLQQQQQGVIVTAPGTTTTTTVNNSIGDDSDRSSTTTSNSIKWPDAAPTPGLDGSIITVSAGNTHLLWAFHQVIPRSQALSSVLSGGYNREAMTKEKSGKMDGQDDKNSEKREEYVVAPEFLWRTPHITAIDLMNNDREATKSGRGGRYGDNKRSGGGDGGVEETESLSKHLPSEVHHYIWGHAKKTKTRVRAAQPTYENARQAALERSRAFDLPSLESLEEEKDDDEDDIDDDMEGNRETMKTRNGNGRKSKKTRPKPMAMVGRVKVYLVSSNAEQTANIIQLWTGAVPCSVYHLRGSDFFAHDDGLYDGMGVDRCANLLGALEKKRRFKANAEAVAIVDAMAEDGDVAVSRSRKEKVEDEEEDKSVLVIDGGTAMTYTALDKNGRIMGGGIGPGLNLKFRSLQEYTCALPYIRPDRVVEKIEAALDGSGSGPFPLFALSTEEAILTDVLSETTLKMRRVIAGFIEAVSAAPSSSTADAAEGAAAEGKMDDCVPEIGDGTEKEKNPKQHQKKKEEEKKFKDKYHVYFAGGDGETLKKLCGSSTDKIVPYQTSKSAKSADDSGDKGKIDDENEDAEATIVNSCRLVYDRQLVHYGIKAAVERHVTDKSILVQRERVRREEERLRQEELLREKRRAMRLELEKFVNQRVAKRFKIDTSLSAVGSDGVVEDDDVFRGSIAKILEGKGVGTGSGGGEAEGGGGSDSSEDFFLIEYDDGGTEHVKLKDLHKMLALFRDVGEMEPGRKNGKKLPAAAAKKRSSRGSSPAPTVPASTSASADAAGAQAKDVIFPAATQGVTPTAAAKPAMDHAAAAYAYATQGGQGRGKKRSAPPDGTSPRPQQQQQKQQQQSAIPRKRQRKTAPASSPSPKRPDPSKFPEFYTNKRIGKFFPPGNDLYFGTITEYNSDTEAECGIYWHCEYDDGDSEDFDLSELIEAVRVYEKHKHKDDSPIPETVAVAVAVPAATATSSKTGETNSEAAGTNALTAAAETTAASVSSSDKSNAFNTPSATTTSPTGNTETMVETPKRSGGGGEGGGRRGSGNIASTAASPDEPDSGSGAASKPYAGAGPLPSFLQAIQQSPAAPTNASPQQSKRNESATAPSVAPDDADVDVAETMDTTPHADADGVERMDTNTTASDREEEELLFGEAEQQIAAVREEEGGDGEVGGEGAVGTNNKKSSGDIADPEVLPHVVHRTSEAVRDEDGEEESNITEERGGEGTSSSHSTSRDDGGTSAAENAEPGTGDVGAGANSTETQISSPSGPSSTKETSPEANSASGVSTEVSSGPESNDGDEDTGAASTLTTEARAQTTEPSAETTAATMVGGEAVSAEDSTVDVEGMGSTNQEQGDAAALPPQSVGSVPASASASVSSQVMAETENQGKEVKAESLENICSAKPREEEADPSKSRSSSLGTVQDPLVID